jgi:hypothetical protein
MDSSPSLPSISSSSQALAISSNEGGESHPRAESTADITAFPELEAGHSFLTLIIWLLAILRFASVGVVLFSGRGQQAVL